MPLSANQGGVLHITGQYQDNTGAAVDPTTPLVSFYDPTGAIVGSAVTPTRDGVGAYHYDYSLSLTALLGLWRAHWSGYINGVLAAGDEYFTVNPAGGGSVIFSDTALAITTPYATGAYITVAEYKAAPTAVDTSNLVVGGNQAAQDAELARVILRASGWANVMANQNLLAQVNTEVGRLRPNRQGEITVIPDCFPIAEVQDFRSGTSPSNMVALSDLSAIFIEETSFTVTQPVALSSSLGALQFSSAAAGRRLFCRWTYVSGWPKTTIVGSPIAGATAVTVADSTGIYQGTRLSIIDGVNTETVFVSAVSGTVLTVSALAFGHAAGVSIGSLPPEIAYAVVLLTSALIKSRSSGAVVLDALDGNPTKTAAKEAVSSEDVAQAKAILCNFAQI